MLTSASFAFYLGIFTLRFSAFLLYDKQSMTPAKDDKWWASKTYVLAEKLKLPTKDSPSNRKAADAPLTRGEMAVLMASYHNMKAEKPTFQQLRKSPKPLIFKGFSF